jgi:hypothetical protein
MAGRFRCYQGNFEIENDLELLNWFVTIVKALVKANDHVVMDALDHNCLLEGAKAATKNIYKVKHLCNESMEA